MKTSFSSLSIESRKELDNWLNSIPMFSSAGKSAMNAYSLKQIMAFLAHIGNPERNYFCIHVAGTNGKGSTVRILESIYTTAGYKVGATISPHLIDYAERFTICGMKVSDEALIQFFSTYKDVLISFELSYFEMATAFAFWWFSEQKVDLAIVECGLGGRLDATNVLEDKLAIITSIGLDHTDILGNTLFEIASEKAGILRANQPFFIGDLKEEPLRAIKSIQQKVGAIWVEKSSGNQVKPMLGNGLGCYQIGENTKPIQTNLFNPIQSKNIELAINAVESLSDRWPIPAEKIRLGLEQCIIPARFEPIFPDKRWFFDGFHNLESLEHTLRLVNSMGYKPLFVLSFMVDKFTPEIREIVSQLPDFIMVKSDNPRALKPEEFEAKWVEISALNNIYNNFADSLVIVGGSFYFYRSVKEWTSSLL